MPRARTTPAVEKARRPSSPWQEQSGILIDFLGLMILTRDHTLGCVIHQHAISLFYLGCWSFLGFVWVSVDLVLLLDIQSFAHLSALRSVDRPCCELDRQRCKKIQNSRDYPAGLPSKERSGHGGASPRLHHLNSSAPVLERVSGQLRCIPSRTHWTSSLPSEEFLLPPESTRRAESTSDSDPKWSLYLLVPCWMEDPKWSTQSKFVKELCWVRCNFLTSLSPPFRSVMVSNLC